MSEGWFNTLGSFPSLSNLGANYGVFRSMRDDYASQVRHLRRRVYQDMVHSMKEAGLNPILAAGASPIMGSAMQQGGASAMTNLGIGSALAANQQADAAERQADVAAVKAPSEVGLNVMKKYEMAAMLDYNSALTARTKAETLLRQQEAGNAAVQRAMWIAEAQKDGASAAQLRDLLNIQAGDPRHIVGRMVNSARDTDRELGGWGGLFQSFETTVRDAVRNAGKAAPKRGGY